MERSKERRRRRRRGWNKEGRAEEAERILERINIYLVRHGRRTTDSVYYLATNDNDEGDSDALLRPPSDDDLAAAFASVAMVDALEEKAVGVVEATCVDINVSPHTSQFKAHRREMERLLASDLLDDPIVQQDEAAARVATLYTGCATILDETLADIDNIDGPTLAPVNNLQQQQQQESSNLCNRPQMRSATNNLQELLAQSRAAVDSLIMARAALASVKTAQQTKNNNGTARVMVAAPPRDVAPAQTNATDASISSVRLPWWPMVRCDIMFIVLGFNAMMDRSTKFQEARNEIKGPRVRFQL